MDVPEGSVQQPEVDFLLAAGQVSWDVVSLYSGTVVLSLQSTHQTQEVFMLARTSMMVTIEKKKFNFS